MMFTIGRLSEIAGVSIRTIRHYHQIGLLAEPARDEYGHRRYGSAELIMVLRVRRLVEIGFALREIGDLLDAPAETLRASLDELDAELASRQERLATRRAALARFRELDRDPRLPDAVANAQTMLAAWGLSPTAIEAERDIVLLASAVLRPALVDRSGSAEPGARSGPIDDAETSMAKALFDDVYTRLIGVDGGRVSRAIYAEMEAVRDLPADHPRVDALIEASTAFLHRHAELLRHWGDSQWQAAPSLSEAMVTTLFEDFVGSLPPAHVRLIRSLQRVFADLDAAPADPDTI
ncbi:MULTISPECIES: MerR family transcriptional regulator [Actinoalloteichus]|uniref:Transcriptional regulator n=1 Tax=Actinoalloteichus fjordicus TaxID=1612552 RepID=A0AAC9LJK1_9PSEU|nr:MULTISPECIES: MerR family transcriptional regulator [Actinoalloteichus]APU17852.1 putative transcriptional regulator [Actinoalloteichus fjordicus]APU23930.1 putative transcriptional regulator [Actinoalloteichus sp. GBA129-24]